MLRNVVLIFRTRLLVRVFNFALAVLIARAFGAELQGVISYMIVLCGLFFTISAFGLEAGAIFFPRRRAMPDVEYLRRAMPLLLINSIILNLAFHVVAEFWLISYFEQYPRLLRILVGLIFPLEIFTRVFRQILLVRDQVSGYNRIDLFRSALTLLFMASAILLFGKSMAPVLGAYCLSRFIALLVALRYLHLPLLSWTFSGLREVIGYCHNPWLANLLSLLNLRLDAIMVSWFVGLSMGVSPADLGLYTICVLTISRVMDLQASVQTAFFPAVAEMEIAEARSLAARVYRLSFPIYFLLGLGILALGYPVLLLFGPEYPAAYPALAVLTVGVIIVRSNSGAISLYFTSSSDPKVPVYMHLMGLGANIVLNLLLIPRLGILGAALATAGSAVLAKLYLNRRFLREIEGSWWRDLRLTRSELVESLDILWRKTKTAVSRERAA